MPTRPNAWGIGAIEWRRDGCKRHEPHTADTARYLDRRLVDHPRCGAFDLAKTSAASADRHRRGKNGRATCRDRLCAAFYLCPEQPGGNAAAHSGHGARCRARSGGPTGTALQGSIKPCHRLCQRRLCHLRHGDPCIDNGDPAAALVPLEVVKYQILLMFLLSGGSGMSALATSYLAAWRLTDERQRLRLDRLQ